MIRYQVVSSYKIELLESRVNTLIDKGYEPLGGMIPRGEPVRGEEVFYQTMYQPAREYFVHQGIDMAAPGTDISSVVDKPNRMIVENPENNKPPKRPKANPPAKLYGDDKK